jgi:hypothetical protein
MRKFIRKVRRFTTGKTFVRVTAIAVILTMAVLTPVHMAYAGNTASAANDTVAIGTVAAIALGVAAAAGCPPCAAAAAGFAIGSAFISWATADTGSGSVYTQVEGQ